MKLEKVINMEFCVLKPPERFGKVKVINNLVTNFNEKNW